MLALQDVTDNHEEAAKVAPQTLRLCQMVRCGASAKPHMGSFLDDDLVTFFAPTCTDHAWQANVRVGFAAQLEEKEDWEDAIEETFQRFEEETSRKAVFTVCFY